MVKKLLSFEEYKKKLCRNTQSKKQPLETIQHVSTSSGDHQFDSHGSKFLVGEEPSSSSLDTFDFEHKKLGGQPS